MATLNRALGIVRLFWTTIGVCMVTQLFYPSLFLSTFKMWMENNNQSSGNLG